MGTVPGTPTTASGGTYTGLRKTAWSAKARLDSVLPSIFNSTGIKTVYKINDANEISIVKNGIVMDLENVGRPQGAQSVRYALRTPLRKRAKYGTETVLGNEDESDLYWGEAFYNEIKKGVKMNTYGYNFNDTEYLNYNAGYDPLLFGFHAENDDTRFQQALMLTNSEELTFAPVSKARQFNKNIIVPNYTSNGVTFDVDALTDTAGSADSDEYYSSRTLSGAGTFVENIAAALMEAAGTGANPFALLTVETMAQIYEYVISNRIVEPIMMDGQPTIIWKIGTPTKAWAMNPKNTGSLAEYTLNVADYKDPKRHTITGEMGRAYDVFLMVHDPRTPTLKVAGSSGSYTLTPGFVQPGGNDDRNLSAWSNTSGATNYVFDVSMLLGANALVRYRRDDLKAGLTESTEYGQIMGKSTYKGEGVQLCRYDKDAASQTASTQIYRGSALVPISRRRIAAAITS